MAPREHTKPSIESLDEAISQLRLALSSLQKARNSLTPIARLPDELMEQIFLRVVFNDLRRAIDWLDFAFSQTSHHLREVALNCPMLWSSPICYAPALAEEMVRRSSGCALDLLASFSHPPMWPSVPRSFYPLVLGTQGWIHTELIGLSVTPTRYPSEETSILPRGEVLLSSIVNTQQHWIQSLSVDASNSALHQIGSGFSSVASSLERISLIRGDYLPMHPSVTVQPDEDEVSLDTFYHALPDTLHHIRLQSIAFDWTSITRFSLTTLARMPSTPPDPDVGCYLQ
jgi:hypothetical protein